MLNMDLNTLWNNMGLWSPSTKSFAEACSALARAVGDKVKLGPTDRIADVGCGNGDSLLLWKRYYRAEKVVGFTSLHAHTQTAQALLKTEGFSESEASCHVGDGAGCLRTWEGLAPTAIVSIDAAYHFNTRNDCLASAFTTLAPNGRLGLTDLLLAPNLTFKDKMFMRIICLFSHVPWANMHDQVEYEAQIRLTGFHDVQVEDISSRVFLPLASYIKEKDRKFGSVFGSEWSGLVMFARVLEWWGQTGTVRFVIVTARKPDLDAT
ncbi:S-adenosyl-L-methionine-dependent methyltransferase [Meredithblackwellia eburnea MCA 4105]